MKLLKLSNVNFDEWVEGLRTRAVPRLFVTVSGYEERSSYWARKILEPRAVDRNHPWCVLGFVDAKTELTRQDNDKFYKGHGLFVPEFPNTDSDGVLDLVLKEVEVVMRQNPKHGIEVHVDYSSMPRLWYCSLFVLLERSLRSIDRLFFWYSAGIYEATDYPTAGVSDITVFSGHPSLSPKTRTHIFGLGFDRIRASAIFRVLDPQNLICFYGDPVVRHEYVQKVNRDNRDLLSSAKLVFTAPIADFGTAFGRINSITREAAASGDVILVPDGPKPLILASSLVPCFLGSRGIVSLHVRRRKSESRTLVNVRPTGQLFGFSVAGSAAPKEEGLVANNSE
jgi:hypothetical protein